MKRVIATAARLAAITFVVGSLGFGARVALASQPSTCPWDPPTLLGECQTQQECQALCDSYNPPGSTYGACGLAHCCVCIELK
jgi:hypothetical protein